MRFGFPGGPRLEWYDRNPQKIFQYYAATLAPHGVTIRWTYTTPTGKKTILRGFFQHMRRVTAATALGLAWSDIDDGTKIHSRLTHYVNSVESVQRDITPIEALLLPSDALRASTGDSSTGGTVEFIVSASLTEFDA